MSKKKDESKGIDLSEILQSGRELFDKPLDIIPISPTLDFGLSGGLIKGIWVVLSGQAKQGKTSLALRMAACCQKHGMKDVYYTDAEGRFKALNLKGTYGLDVDNFHLIRSTPDKIYTGEELVQINIQLVKDKPNSVFILDSASALCPEDEMSSEVKASGRSSTPKLLATFFRRVGTILPVQESIFIVIQHLIANTSGYGSPYVEDGGQKVKYQADVKMKCKGTEKWEEADKRVGQIVKWDIECSALGPPGIPVQNYLRYGYGIDIEQEIMVMSIDFGLILKGGAWYSFAKEDKKTKELNTSLIWGDENFHKYFAEKEIDPKDINIQGEANLRQYLVEHPLLVEILYKKIKTMI